MSPPSVFREDAGSLVDGVMVAGVDQPILGYLAVSPTVRSFSAPVGLRSQQRPTPRNRSLDGVSAVDPTDFPAAALAWITALSMPPVTKELTIEPRFMFGTDWYMEALDPNANQFLTEATNIVISRFGRWNAGKKIVATAQSGRPR